MTTTYHAKIDIRTFTSLDIATYTAYDANGALCYVHLPMLRTQYRGMEFTGVSIADTTLLAPVKAFDVLFKITAH